MLHQHFKTPQTGGAIRSYYLAKALVDHGHRVVMITAFNKHSYTIENVDGIEVHYLPIAYDNRYKFYARGWAFMSFTVRAARLAGTFRNFDQCYAISVPLTVGLIARWIKFRFRIPFFFEVGDLWPDAPVQMGFAKNYFFKRMLYALEKSIYRQAKAIVALSPSIGSAIQKKVPKKQIHVIPNMADCDFYKPEQKNNGIEIKYHVKDKFVISYIGAVGVANGLDYFLECANVTRKANLPVHFILCGDGALREDLKQRARELDLQNLTFIDFVNREGVKEIMNVTDAVFVCYKNLPILETGSPNKFFDGLAAGKLIVINFGGWIKNEIEENHCGIFVDPLEPGDFVKKISPFISQKELLRGYQNSSREVGERKYSREHLTEVFAKLFF